MLSTYEELLKFLNLLEPLDSKLLFPSDLFYESIYFLFNKDLYFFFYVQTLLCNYPVILAFLIIFYLYLILILTSFVDTYIMPITKNYRKHFFFYGFLATIYLEIAFLFCFIISLICFLWLFILFKIYIYSYFFNDFTYLNILLSLKVIFCFLQNYILFTIKKFFFSSQIFLYLNFFYKIFLILLSVLLAIPSTLYTLFYNFFFLPLFFNYISYLFLFFFKTIQYLFFNNTILVFLGFFFFFFFLKLLYFLV